MIFIRHGRHMSSCHTATTQRQLHPNATPTNPPSRMLLPRLDHVTEAVTPSESLEMDSSRMAKAKGAASEPGDPSNVRACVRAPFIAGFMERGWVHVRERRMP